MSGFGFLPNDGFFGLGSPSNPGSPMLSSQIIRDAARSFLSAQGDLPVGKTDLAKAQDAINIANTWIEDRTQFPLTNSNSDGAWSRRDWLESSISGWQQLVEPLADGMVAALSKAITDMTATTDLTDLAQQFSEVNELTDPRLALPFQIPQLGPEAVIPILRGFLGQLIATQLGHAIGALATRVNGSHDVAIPLFEKPGAHVIPENISAWGEGLDIPEQEVAIFLALREVAAERLFTHAPWLSEYLRDLIGAYGRGITVDINSIQEQAQEAMESGQLDITNPQSLTLAINQGMFQPEQSATQAAALAKLEMALALIEGWIEHVTQLSAKDRLPAFYALQESLRRSRIQNAPARQLFSSLLGLEVSPKKLRECTNFWNEVYALGGEAGNEVRDHRWEDPALLPTSDELSDPAAFLASTTVPDDLSGLI